MLFELRSACVEPQRPDTSAARAPEIQTAAVGERVRVAFALLAVVFAVLVARAVAALAVVLERASARNRVLLVQVAAVPANSVVHVVHPRNVLRIFKRKYFRPAATVKADGLRRRSLSRLFLRSPVRREHALA